jgi:N6-adenosine-specific RNA methylase IME4
MRILSFDHHRLTMAAPAEERPLWLAKAAAEGLSSNQLRAAIAHDAAFQRTRDVELEAGSLGKFVVIYGDPPWRYEHQPMGSSSRSIENHYPTMALDEICALPVASLAHENSVLFLWATVPKLFECKQVLDAWGFTYRTGLVWVKDKIGMGYYARGRHELLQIAARGELPVPAAETRPDSVIEAPRLEHSAKPPIVYDIIDRMYPGVRKLELFQRVPRDGWVGWGN